MRSSSGQCLLVKGMRSAIDQPRTAIATEVAAWADRCAAAGAFGLEQHFLAHVTDLDNARQRHPVSRAGQVEGRPDAGDRPANGPCEHRQSPAQGCSPASATPRPTRLLIVALATIAANP